MTSPLATPVRLNLGPAAVINGETVDLSVYVGRDWVGLDMPFYAPDGVTPISLSQPLMQIRAAADITSPLLVVPTVTATGNTVSIRIPGSASTAVTLTRGAYDLSAVRADNGERVPLLFGLVTFVLPATITT